MPNWCETNIRITLGQDIEESQKEEAKKQLADLIAKVQGSEKKGAFLDVLYPTPEDLMITSGSATDNGVAVIMSTKYNDHNLIDAMMKYQWVKDEPSIKTREDLIIHLTTGENASCTNLKEGQQAIDNIVKYKCKDWYDWRNRNWGTKWDLSDMQFEVLGEDEVFIQSSTAWSPPLEGVRKISEEFNLLHFQIEYAEGGYGFEGTAEIENGDLDDDCRDYDYSRDEVFDEDEVLDEDDN
jgi:hypothetical protein